MQTEEKAASEGGNQITFAPVVPVVRQQPNEPEFYAMPGPGQVLEGLRRGALYCLWRDGEIETVSPSKINLQSVGVSGVITSRPQPQQHR